MPQRRTTPELKLLYGVQPNETKRADAPTPSRREPEPPADLSELELELWRGVTDELREMGQLSAADVHEITAYVQLVAMVARLHAELADAALSAVNLDTGVRHANPLLAAYDRAVSRAHHLATSLGLNPHGRSLIHGRAPASTTEPTPAVPDLYSA